MRAVALASAGARMDEREIGYRPLNALDLVGGHPAVERRVDAYVYGDSCDLTPAG
jgi:hypothetical protein